MRLVVVSHPCVVPENQEFFCDVERVSGWRLTLVTPARWKSDYGLQRARRNPELRGEFLPTPVQLPGHIPGHFYGRRLSSLLTARRPDAVYVHNEPYAISTLQTFFSARALAPVPIGFYSAQNLLKRLPWPLSRGEASVFRGAAFALPISPSVGEVLRAKGYEGRMEVLPLGLRTEDRPAPRNAHRQTKSNEATFTLGYVGRLSHEKGVDSILEALKRLPADRFRATIAGDGPERDRLEQRARELGLWGRVDWRGYVPHADQESKYRDIDLLVVPSRTMPNWQEQFGRVVLEALSYEKPVLTSDSGELPNLVSATGGGCTFREDDVADLVSRVEEMQAQPERLAKWGSEGRKAVERHFDSRVLAQRFCEVIEAVQADAGTSTAFS